MQVFTNLNPALTAPLEQYRRWMMQPRVTELLEASMNRKGNAHVANGVPEEPCSDAYLTAMDHGRHVGYPVHSHMIDINYTVLRKDEKRVDASLLDEIREQDQALDDELQTFLGARFCALKAYYPKHGHIGWHNNWNAAGYNIIFTYSATGDGYWRHIEPGAESGLVPDLSKSVHLKDPAGWHCKVGYFGSKQELDRVKWHCAYTNEPRITVGYVIYDRAIWENMVQEIQRS